ncbi:lipase maturation factor family protein [Thiocapsa bogorovii]|uniref:lipase maturation factor family protein n=1 Tax=Thiocapsa bogorovii TaxID=521689 RepID=UPI001E2F60FD|nr:lipase maturation factor family protein [Thiocapsa bogorovii]UHD18072.1 lipase maturation factor family protein [Thiocapsa bogorovii]
MFPSIARLTGEAAGYRLLAWVFVRLLAVIYLVAFVSFAVQVEALAGSQGIYPIAEQLALAAEQHGQLRVLFYPSLFWLASGDAALLAVAWGGAVSATLLLVLPWLGWGRVERLVLILLYLLYLSLYHTGQFFTNFQWDYLLLETGFLAILLPGGSRLVVWLFRWLLFRLRFESGLAKLLSGDPAWRDLTALRYYFETQPLPHVGSWYAHHLPDWLLRVGTGGTLVVELIVPFFMFLPRPWRLFAAGATVFWQVLIIATSNHNFFNLLTILLCLFLLDDRAISPVVPRRWRRLAEAGATLPQQPPRRQAVLTIVLTLILVPASLVSGAELVAGRTFEPVSTWVRGLNAFRLANRYHVFPTIETERIEIQIEASPDGAQWQPLDFRYRPGDPAQAPRFIVPHQPRVDWMLWFTPMSPIFLDWLERFLDRLLEGSEPVTSLLAHPPTGAEPPRFLRLQVWRYRFSSPEQRAGTGAWWQREPLGPFYPLPAAMRPPISGEGGNADGASRSRDDRDE